MQAVHRTMRQGLRGEAAIAGPWGRKSVTGDNIQGLPEGGLADLVSFSQTLDCHLAS